MSFSPHSFPCRMTQHFLCNGRVRRSRFRDAGVTFRILRDAPPHTHLPKELKIEKKTLKNINIQEKK
jgi:hypothetical protein